MRAQRQKIRLLEEGKADEQAIINARARYVKTSDEYVNFSDKVGLSQQWDRVTVGSNGNIKGIAKPKKAETPQQLLKSGDSGKSERLKGEKTVANSVDNGIMKTDKISGALNPLSSKAEEHAARYYESVRHMKTDTERIAKTTGISKDKLDKIKNHIFIAEHNLVDGKRRFDPDYEMAQSWQRLISGNIKEQDMFLLKHEYAELRYMEKGLTQSEAHIKASHRYNFAKYCE